MEAAFKDADIVYPKSWAPFQVMERRTELLKKSDKDGLKALEKECLANNAKFTSWECDRAKMNLTKDGKALYMHCLPADITDVSCKAGEVSAEVFEQYRIPTYQEAAYKPFVISALMFLARIEGPRRQARGDRRRARRKPEHLKETRHVAHLSNHRNRRPGSPPADGEALPGAGNRHPHVQADARPVASPGHRRRRS